MVDSVFDSLMIHTCSFVKASTTTDDLGQQVVSWTGGTTTSGVPCRLTPAVKREFATGAVLSDYTLYVDNDDVPSTLLLAGAEDVHRVSAVLDRDSGSSINAGPFDIKEIADQAGEAHHLRLRLMSVT